MLAVVVQNALRGLIGNHRNAKLLLDVLSIIKDILGLLLGSSKVSDQVLIGFRLIVWKAIFLPDRI